MVSEKGWSLSFLDFLAVWWAPIKEASGDWTLLIRIQINFLADRAVSFFFPLVLSATLPVREGQWDVFSIPFLFRLYQSPKRQMKSWSLLFYDNNHLVTPHIRLNLSYTSLQINLCQPLFDSPHTILISSCPIECPQSPKTTRLFMSVWNIIAPQYILNITYYHCWIFHLQFGIKSKRCGGGFPHETWQT